MAPDVLRGPDRSYPIGVLCPALRVPVADRALGVLNLFAFRTEGQFQDADGREWRMGRSHWWRRNYELRAGDTVVATAQGRGSGRSFWTWTSWGNRIVWSPTDWWGGKWRLLGPAGTAVLEIRRREVLRPGLVLDVLGPVAGELMAFAVYLILTVWREHAAAASV